MKTKYVICLIFTKQFPERLRIESIMFHGAIGHPENIDPKDVFDKQKAIDDALKEEKSMKLLKDGFSYFLTNHILLPEK